MTLPIISGTMIMSRRCVLTRSCRRLMNVGGSVSRRLVFTPEVLEDNVPADVVLLAVDAIFTVTLGAREAASKLVIAVDNLVWRRDDAVGRGELEWAVHALLLMAVLPATLPVAAPGLLAVPPGRSGSGGCDSQNSGDLRYLHLELFGKDLVEFVALLCWMRVLMS